MMCLDEEEKVSGASGSSRALACLRLIMIWLLRAIVAMISVSFGVAATLDAQWNMNSGQVMMYGTTGIALAGPSFLICSHEALRRRSYIWGLAMFVLSIALMAISMTISLGGVATVKDALRSTRETATANAELDRNRRQEVTEEIAAKRLVTGGETPEMIRPALAALEAACEAGRKKACVKSEEGQRKLAAAERVAELEAKRDRWPTMLSDVSKSADPQIENLTVMGQDLGISIPAQSLRAGLNAGWVIALELIGYFGPLAAFAWGRPKTTRTWLRRRQDKPVMQDTPKTDQDEAHPTPRPAPMMEIVLTQDEPRMALTDQRILPVMAAPAEPPKLDAPAPQDEAPDLPRMKAPSCPRPTQDDPHYKTVKAWVDDRIETGDESQRILYRDAFDDYHKWCSVRGMRPCDDRMFGSKMADAGWQQGKGANLGSATYKAKAGGKIWFFGASFRVAPGLRIVAG